MSEEIGEDLGLTTGSEAAPGRKIGSSGIPRFSGGNTDSLFSEAVSFRLLALGDFVFFLVEITGF